MKSYKVTDVGSIRELNEDYVFASDRPVGHMDSLYLLADGMGGHAGGEIASRYAVQEVVDYLSHCETANPIAALNEAVRHANAKLRDTSVHTVYEGMGTTLVGAVVSGRTLSISNIGDSRLYVLSGSLSQITRDHSWVEEMAALGKLDRDSQVYWEKKNVITRAIGVTDKVTADLFEVDLKKGDLILLCSDGLTNMVPDQDIERVLSSTLGLEEKCMQLMDMALRAGGKDNISVILVDPEIDEVAAC